MHIAVQECADVFVSRGNVVLFQNAQNDSRIGHARDLDVVQIIINPEALFESQLERLYTRAAGMNQRAVDVEKEKPFLRLCHVKRSRDISYCSLAKSQSGVRTLRLLKFQLPNKSRTSTVKSSNCLHGLRRHRILWIGCLSLIETWNLG